MPKRLITVLAAALALLIAGPAFAQDPTATAQPGQPPANATEAVKQIYNDYRADGKIDVCTHQRDDLQKALDTIEPQFDTDYPDFREALEAGIQRHDKGRCAEDTATPTATATATASATATAAPTTESGTLPPSQGDNVSGGPESGGLPPAAETPTPGATTAPPAAVPTVPPATAPVTPAPTATATIVTQSNSGSLLIPGIILGVALLGGAALALSAFFARRNPTWDHAWREAGYRVRGTWADFSDWLKLGR